MIGLDVVTIYKGAYAPLYIVTYEDKDFWCTLRKCRVNAH